MSSSFSRLLILFLAIGALASTVGSAAPPQPAAAGTRLVSSATVVDAPDRRPDRSQFRASPTSTPTPVATSTPRPAPQRPTATLHPIPVPAIDAQEVALVNLDTGRFLWQRNARTAWAPASLTKIFTAMVASDLMGMNTMVTVPASISQLPPDSTVMGLTAGERLSVRELLYGVFLDSGNDAAETLASGVTSRSTFIADMNLRATRLGLRTTHFVNPTGLDAAGHYSSADDLAVAALYLESHYPGLVAIAATPAIAIPATATHKAFALVNIDDETGRRVHPDPHDRSRAHLAPAQSADAGEKLGHREGLHQVVVRAVVESGDSIFH